MSLREKSTTRLLTRTKDELGRQDDLVLATGGARHATEAEQPEGSVPGGSSKTAVLLRILCVNVSLLAGLVRGQELDSVRQTDRERGRD